MIRQIKKAIGHILIWATIAHWILSIASPALLPEHPILFFVNLAVMVAAIKSDWWHRFTFSLAFHD